MGKYWARWSGALVEAGFPPNELTSAYPDDYLYAKLVGLCRKVGHFPTRVEIQLERRADAEFPTVTVFQRRGSKHSVASALASYCQTRPDLADVLSMCEAVPLQRRTPDGPNEELHFGFVYLLKVGRFFKIGRTNSVGRRERELALQLPEKATLLHSIKTDDPVGIEQYWHQRFASFRANGEWFALLPEHVNAFRRRRFM